MINHMSGNSFKDFYSVSYFNTRATNEGFKHLEVIEKSTFITNRLEEFLKFSKELQRIEVTQ